MCVLALGLMGCGETTGTGGSGGDGGGGGDGGSGGMTGQEFPCTEQGILDAIAEGGGPHTFGCNGPQTVVTKAEILIDNDVILDGEGNLTVDGNDDHDVFAVAEGVTAELQGFAVTNGADDPSISGAGGIRIRANATLRLTNSIVSGNTGSGLGGGITNRGSLTLTDSAVSGNRGSGIFNVSGGTLTLTNSTVSGNTAIQKGGGIYNLRGGMLTLVNSTVSGNSAAAGGGGICNCGSLDPAGGTVTLVNSTVSGNSGGAGEDGILSEDGTVTVTNSLVDDACGGVITSNGYNIESPGDTCGFDPDGTDLVDVTEEQLNLGELAGNGGPTMTHALLPGSVAIDRIPEGDCAVDADQRHVSRPRGDGCDVGAVEVDLACVGADVGSECAHRNFTGVCGADTCWATDCSELSDGINCLVPRNRVTFPGRCAAGSCEEETVFP
jgi:hypothetical protein